MVPEALAVTGANSLAMPFKVKKVSLVKTHSFFLVTKALLCFAERDDSRNCLKILWNYSLFSE
jgi:hypothetical protein